MQKNLLYTLGTLLGFLLLVMVIGGMVAAAYPGVM